MEFLNQLEQVNYLIDSEDYESAIAALEKYIEADPEKLIYYWYLGLIYLLQENEELAQEIWLSIFLQGTIEEVKEWTTELINFLETKVKENIATKKLGNAKVIYEAIISIIPDYVNPILLDDLIQLLSYFATNLRCNNKQEMAIKVYLDILKFSPNHSLSWYSLALCYYYLGEYIEAEYAIRKSIQVETSINNLYILGTILEQKKDYIEAIKIYTQIINIISNISDFSDGFQEMQDVYEKLGKTYFSCQNSDKSVDICLEISKYFVVTNQTKKAIDFMAQALSIFPENLSLKVFNQSITPIIFKNKQSIEFYRRRHIYLLNQLLKNNLPKNLDDANDAFLGINRDNNFYFAYQGKNDLSIQKKYSTYIYSVLKLLYPQWCQKIVLSPDIKHRKIRIGLVSQHLEGLGKLYLGWLRYANKKKFEFYVYDLSKVDPNNCKTREQFKINSHQMWYLNKHDNLDDLGSKITSDKLDILIFPEIAVSGRVNPLSRLRLAPIQCTTWSHPITSGSASIDYFLSSDLMEPLNGDKHYCEKLIRLPNLGFSIEEPILLSSNKQRFNFQIKDDSIVYLCCQTLFKYLPQQDYIFARIAQENPLAQFVFFDSYLGPMVTDSFRKRISDAFTQFGLNYEKYCIFLRRMQLDDYLRLNQLSDIFLDSFGWSGGITSKDAIACSLPIVTCPGKLMRGRQSYGMLKMIGVTETIAKNEQEYIDIAVRLGLDSHWRQEMRNRMTANKHLLFNDPECIVALEDFFEAVIYGQLEQKKKNKLNRDG